MTYLGIDFGTTHLKGSVIDRSGAVLAERSARYPKDATSRGTEWSTAFLRIARELREVSASSRFDAVCVTGMAPNVMVSGADRAPGPTILFHEATAYELEVQLDEQLQSPPWANEVLSKLITLDALVDGGARRWFTTHNYLAEWLTGAYVLDYPVASETGSLWRGGEWDRRLLGGFGLTGLELPELAAPLLDLGPVRDADASAVLGSKCRVILGSSDTVGTLVGLGVREGERLFYYGSFNSATQVAPSLRSLVTERQRTAPFDWFCSLPLSGEQVRSTMELLTPGGGFEEFWSEAATSPLGAGGVRFVHTPLGTTSTVSTVPRGTFFHLPVDVTRADLARAVGESFGYALRAFADEQGISSVGGSAVAAGGGAASSAWRQLVSDITGARQRRNPHADLGFGSALLALGGHTSFDALESALAAHEAVAHDTLPDLDRHADYAPHYEEYRELFGWGTRMVRPR